MHKAHIFHLGDIPIFAVFPRERNRILRMLLTKGVEPMKQMITAVFADGGYDSFEIHADIHHFLHARPLIDCRDNAATPKIRVN